MPNQRTLIAIIFTGLLAVAVAQNQDCPPGCTCAHRNGRYTAQCSNARLSEVPKITGHVMELTLTGNGFDKIMEDDYFFYRHLDSLRVLTMSQCGVTKFGPYVFRNMELLEVLDVSDNFLTYLPSHMFDELKALKTLNLAGNKLSQVSATMFDGATGLTELNLEGNEITFIAVSAFRGMPRLQKIDLSDNLLSKLDASKFSAVENTLEILSLGGNPWLCDCHMRQFVQWHLRKMFQPATCSRPSRFHTKSWEILTPEEFACAPSINRLSITTQVSANLGSRITLTCPVSGDPTPTVVWEYTQPKNGTRRKLTDIYGKYMIRMKPAGPNTWNSTLEIDMISGRDQGQYLCTATNPADKVFEVIHLDVNMPTDGSSPQSIQRRKKALNITADMILLIAVLIAAVIIVIVVLTAVFCYRKSTNNEIVANGKVVNHNNHMNGYGYQAIQTNGRAQIDHYYMSPPGQHGGMTVLPPPPPPPQTSSCTTTNNGVLHHATLITANGSATHFDKTHSHNHQNGNVPHHVTFSDSLPSSVQQDDSGYLETADDSPKTICSLHAGATATTPNGHVFRVAPLADGEELKIPLRETAL